MKQALPFIFLFLSTFAHGEVLTTAPSVDVKKYVGKWYALKALPQFFTRNCKAQTAEYGVIDSKTISVLNTCLKKKGQGTISGEATVTNFETNAELEVRFDSFFTRLFRVKGDYNIIRLDENYQYVLVGSKDRKSLWIMSRKPSMPKAIMEDYIQTAKDEGFPIERLTTSEF